MTMKMWKTYLYQQEVVEWLEIGSSQNILVKINYFLYVGCGEVIYSIQLMYKP